MSAIGPIRVSENRRYFVNQNGEPFFWLGDTQWQLCRDFPLADVEVILQDRKRKGFSVLQIMLTGVGNGSKPNCNGDPPWLDSGPVAPNESYFHHADTVLNRIGESGLVCALGVYHQVQASSLTAANARAYASWIASRYRDMPHLIWSMYPAARPEFIPVVREVAAGLQEGDRGSHLITVHPDPAPASSSFIHQEDWMACNMIQPWGHLDKIVPMVSEDYLRTPIKPVVMAEGAYEDPSDSEYGFVVTPHLVRQQAYWSYLSGAMHTYGHTDFWKHPSQWRGALNAPGASQMRVLRDLFTARDWWHLVPETSLLMPSKAVELAQHVAAISIQGDWAMAYLGQRAAISIRMDRLSVDEVAASWVDPRTGQVNAIGLFPTSGTQSFTPPEGWEDAVLLLTSP
jgi:hypothetical protein